MEKLRGRVLRVRPRSDGTFAVLLGPGPNVFWLRTADPPKFGQLLEVLADASTVKAIRHGKLGGTVTILEGGQLSVVADQFARRVVAPAWIKRCQAAMRRPLFAHQAEGAGWIAARLSAGKGAILADEPGLGKTVQAYAALLAARCLPAIVVCPASVKRGFAREAQALRLRLRVRVVRGGTGIIKPAHIIIVNYDVLRAREEQLMALGAKAIVFDECHNLKEPNPNPEHRAAVATRMAHRIGRPLLMTGTPILNRIGELWRQLHIVDRREWPSYTEFRDRYCIAEPDEPDQGRTVITSHGEVTRIDELHARIGPLILRRLKSDVLGALPPKRRRSVLVELQPGDRKHYDACHRDVVKWLRSLGSDAAAMKAARGRALVKMNHLRRLTAVAKLRKALRDYLDGWFAAERRQLVIFAYHVPVIDGIRRICQGLGLRRVGIRGKDSGAQRQRAVDWFNAGNADVFIAPIRAAGVGINLQHRCSDVLYVERDWSPKIIDQSENRVHRIGQRKQVRITFLDAANTVDQHLAEVLLAKQTVIDSVVDDRAEDGQSHTVETIEEVMLRMRG